MLFIVTLLLVFSHISQGSYVVSWGSNSFGQLGIGSQNDVRNPTVVSSYGNVNIVNIRLGLSTHFAMAADGSVYCSGNNIYGQLGINSQVTRILSALTKHNAMQENTYANGLDVFPIGPQTIAYNSTTKDVFGWGLDAGYIQAGFSGTQTTPKKSTDSNFVGIVIGLSTAWSASFVILNGGAYAAGKTLTYSGYTVDNVYKLGTGATQDQPTFVRMSFWNQFPLQKLFPTDSSHVCGLTKSYSLYCWGRNNMGQLGIGNTTDMGIPTLVSFFDDLGLYVGQIKTGDSHTIALTCGGKVYAWGNNARSNLGLGYADSNAHPTPTLIGSLTSLNIIEINSALNSVFARNSTNHWHVWGAATTNITLMPQSGDISAPVVNPYFKQNGLTRLALASKSTFAFAWSDPNPPTDISPDCPALVDECALGMDNCALNTLCTDTERSYKCLCPAGFSGDGISFDAGGTGCIDIDECAVGGYCLPQAMCTNELGSFYCDCPNGYHGDGKMNGTGCTDIDECVEGGYCTANTICTNIVGSYSCRCTTGFRQVAATPCGIICADIDECNTQNSCGPGTWCNNTAGGYSCPCLPGYYGPSCQDVNECVAGTHNCATRSFCYNLPGAFECRCPSGFTGDAISASNGGQGCADINECSTSGVCHPNATCANSAGSFRCTCKAGFSGDGLNCTDNNECAGTNNCVSSIDYGVCNNTVGGYTCGCQAGFSGNGIITSVSGGTGCSDINECTGINKCDSRAKCTNTPGSYTCKCPNGFNGSGFLCYTVNCTTGTYANSSTTCASCPAGTYNNVTAAEKCTPCPAGTYSTGIGKTAASACVTCPKNTYSTVDSTQCLACPPGTTGGTAGTCTPCPAGQYGFQGVCKNCGAGYFSTSPGATDCEPCAPGYFASSNTATSCAACPAGTTSKGRAAGCDLCPAGRYTSTAGQYYCSACPPGSATQNITGLTSCTPCPQGSSASSAGVSSCSACAPGTYSSAIGATTCSSCAPGTYQDQSGQSSCKPCSNWQYSDISGATQCSTCYQGYAGQYEYGSSMCLACPPGTFRTGAGGVAVCTPCFVGSASELAGQAHCQYCMGGSYAKKCGQTTCDVCAPGTYSSFGPTGASSCSYCPYGQESFGTAYFCYF